MASNNSIIPIAILLRRNMEAAMVDMVEAREAVCTEDNTVKVRLRTSLFKSRRSGQGYGGYSQGGYGSQQYDPYNSNSRYGRSIRFSKMH
jgi:hypothetical protein